MDTPKQKTKKMMADGYDMRGERRTLGACGNHIYSYLTVIGVRADFWREGEPFAQKFSQVAQIFTKQSKRNEGLVMH